MLLLLGPIALDAQQLQVMSSAGLTSANAGMVITATIGEPFVGMAAANNQMYTEGFQQGFPNASSSLSEASDREVDSAHWSFDLFPNPTSDVTQIYVKNAKSQIYRFRLLNASGMVLRDMETSEFPYTLDVRDLPAGMYWLSIHSESAGVPQMTPFSKINL